MTLLDQLVTAYANEDLERVFTKVGIQSDKISAARRQPLKEVTLAQWLLESGRATSKLANECLNFAGLKWRGEMEDFAEKQLIQVPSEPSPTDFCKFTNVEAFIVGYWKFLTRSPYAGLEDHTNTPETFIGFLQRKGYAADLNYVDKVMRRLPEAQQLLETAQGIVTPLPLQTLQITRVPRKVEVGQSFRVEGTAAATEIGKVLLVAVDDIHKTDSGTPVGTDGKWQFDFVFHTKGDRKLKVSTRNEMAAVQITAIEAIDGQDNPETATPSGSIIINLSASVGLGGVNRSSDVVAVKQRLRDLGYHWVANNPVADTSLIQVIRLFQSIIAGRNTVSGDGRIDIGAFTHRWLQAGNAPRWQLMPTDGDGYVNYERQQTDDNHDYGTDWLAQAIVGAGKTYQVNYRNANPGAAPIAINDSSLPYGGDTPQHAGHETGLVCDIRLPKKDGTSGGITFNDASFDRPAMRAMLKAIWQQETVRAVFFNDPTLIREGLCVFVAGHANHAHLEISPPPRT